MSACGVGNELRGALSSSSTSSVFTSGALKVETSLLAAHVSQQSRAREETLRILHIAVKALNHLASVMSSYLTAVPNPVCLVPILPALPLLNILATLEFAFLLALQPVWDTAIKFL